MKEQTALLELHRQYSRTGHYYEARRILHLLLFGSVYLTVSDVDDRVYNDVSELPVIWTGNVSKYGSVRVGITK